VFVARQPIFDRSGRVFAYELLFRPSAGADQASTQSHRATARLITDAVLHMGLDTLTQGKLAFINVPYRLVLDGLAESLPPKQVVLELLEDAEADDDVLAACRDLRRAGYAIALDDFELTARNAGLMSVADYVKVDFRLSSCHETRRAVVEGRSNGHPALLAEKIESPDELAAATAEGFEYFQGYFFGRPVTHRGRAIAPERAGYLRLLYALQDPELTVQKFEALIRHDVSLCFRVLRTINSAAFGQMRRVDSISQALVLLGVDTVRRWASLWVLAGLSEQSHPELLTMSTVRARCCEQLAADVRGADGAAEGFLLGMCSLLDAILDRPMDDVLELLPLSEATRAALRGDDNFSRRLLDCAIGCERGDFSDFANLATRAGLTTQDLADAHSEALRWSAELQKLTL
jgi:c-di-GMP-related signal transduction protein